MQSKEKKIKKPVEELKVCIRKLPPNLTQEIFMKSIGNFKDTISNIYYVQGKNKEKYAKFGRCFIVFQDQQSKANFLKDYKPSFIDEKGNRYTAKLEIALYQKDWNGVKATPNKDEGTYEESEEFKAYLEKLKNPKQVHINSNSLNRGFAAIEDASPKRIEKTPLIMDIEKRLNDKRYEKEAKKRKEREKESKYAPKTVIVYQKKEK